jgi:hypothetical protein
MRTFGMATSRFVAIIILLIAANFGVADNCVASGSHDVIILKNTATEIVVRYRTPPTFWNDQQIGETHYRTPQIPKTCYPFPTGAPQIPERVIWLAIPQAAIVSISEITPYGAKHSDYTPAPMPFDSAGSDRMPIAIYRENPEYYSTLGTIPNKWVEITSTQAYRDLNTVRLLVYPFRFSPADRNLAGLDSVDVRIQIKGNTSGGLSFTRPLEDDFLSGLISNWAEPAKKWKAAKNVTTDVTDPWPGGDFYKIPILESGIYKLTYNDLISAGIDLQNLDIRTIRLFDNGGLQLPAAVQIPRPEAPIENAILTIDHNQNNFFDSDDEIIFYGKSVNDWKWNPTWNSGQGRFEHYLSPYTNENIYWLNINPGGPAGKRMSPLGIQTNPTLNPTFTKAYLYEEKDYYGIYDGFNLPIYMPNLFGDLFSGVGASRTFILGLNDLVASAPAHLKVKIQEGDTSTHPFCFYLNGAPLFTSYSKSVPIEINIPAGTLENGMNTLRMDQQSAGNAYLDYYELEYTKSLTASSGRLDFISTSVNGYAGYQIGGLNNPWLFDVTNFDDVKAIQADSFIDTSAALSPKRYIACNESAFLSPGNIAKDLRSGDEYVNLRSTLGADILVIVADEFYDAMAAYENYRETEAPTHAEVLRVRMSDVFDEFGWGLVDPTAIRDFLKSTLPGGGWAVSPLYVLFVGDGDFDYKNSLSDNGANWVIPYELNDTCTDDWYGYFSSGSNQYPEFAFGRWTARSVEDVNTFINRLVTYESTPNFEPWRDQISFVADDEYGENGVFSLSETTHTIDTENLAENYVPKFFNTQKIYLTEYPPIWNGSGVKEKPGATRDLIDAINEGRLIINFIGHGNPTVWTHEHTFLQSRDIPLLQNGVKLPLFIAATCDWAYWDSPFDQSMPEAMLNLPNGGAIAAIAATRTTYSGPNASFSFNLYSEIFADDIGHRLGEAMMRAKSLNYGLDRGEGIASNSNSQKYHLLGDPFMILAMPQLKVALDSTQIDTLNALDPVQLSGKITTSSGEFVPDFQGIAHLQLYDVRIPVFYNLAHTPTPPTTPTYVLPGNLIFRGDVSVENGEFQSSFVVPVDISYGASGGRISIYAYSNDIDGTGYNDSIRFGSSVGMLQDSIPPSVKIYFDTPGFRSGDPINAQAKLYVEIADSNGINLTGSVGHALLVTVDEQNPIDLTSSFSYFLNSHTTGRAEYQFSPGEFSAGNHNVHAIAWDAANNPSTADATFNLMNPGELKLTQVLNYPNPVKNNTRFTFFLTEPAQVTIKIYTVSGKLVKSISNINGVASFNYDDPQLAWNGRDGEGDDLSNGVYLYKIIAKGISGKEVSEKGKLIIMR